ncbi:hypothetical protein D3C77_331290 [compost metagenome]
MLLQQVERRFKLLALGWNVFAKTLQHQHVEIAQSGLELFDVLDQKQCFEHAHRVWVAKVPFGIVDGALNSAFQRAANAFEHAIEGGQLAH